MASRDRPARSPWILVTIVAASGFAGLGYEMVWTRLFSVALGTDMMAVLGSIAGFFAGMALGAYALDAPLRQARSPRIAYAGLELVIGAWGLVSMWLLPAAGRLMPPLLGTHPAPALLWAASFALPALTLLPATIAMGGTLTALERMLSTTRGETRCSAGVYAANTAGAVGGTLISAFFLFPSLGLSGTLAVLSAINVLCAVGALKWGTDDVISTDTTREAPRSGLAPAIRVTDARLVGTLFASGLLGIAVEVLVVRLAAQALQDTLYTFAGLLSAYLAGTALGGWLYQRLGRGATSSTSALLLSLTAATCLISAIVAPLITKVAEQLAGFGEMGELGVALALFLLPSIAMGALFGHLLQRVRDVRGSIGWAVSINSVGAALAPLVACQFLIPMLGAWRALVGVAVAYLLLLPVRRRSFLWGSGPALAAAALLLLPAPSLIRVPDGGSLLAVRDGPMMTASVVDDAGGVRYLEINGHFRMGGTSSMRSDYRQALLPLLLHPAPHTALFLGVGTGATLVGGAQMPGVSVKGVELSPEVAELLPWFANPEKPSSAPTVNIADARRYVAADKQQYDVIIADLFHPALDGSGALYTTEHFAAVKNRLAAGGLFCQWLPLYQLDEPSLRAIVRSFLAVYPNGSAWLNHYSVRTPMLALVGFEGTKRLDLPGLTHTLDRTAVADVTRPLGLSKPMDVLGQFVGGPRALSAFAGAGPLNTDDQPFVALDARRNVRALRAPPAELLISLIGKVKPDVAELDRAVSPMPAEQTTRLGAYWRARDRFLETGAALGDSLRGNALVAAASPGLLDTIRLSPDFDPAYQPLLAMAQALLAGEREAGLTLLRQIVTAAPYRPEARALLTAAGG